MSSAASAARSRDRRQVLPIGPRSTGRPSVPSAEVAADNWPPTRRAALPDIVDAATAAAALQCVAGGRVVAEMGWSVDPVNRAFELNLSGEQDPGDLPVARIPWEAAGSSEARSSLVAGSEGLNIPAWYEPNPGGMTRPRIGTLDKLVIVGDEVQAIACAAAGLRVACMPTAGPGRLTENQLAEVRQSAPQGVAVVAEATEAGVRRGVSVASMLIAAGVSAELRAWPDGTVPGYTVTDAVIHLGHVGDDVRATVQRMAIVPLPPIPPGGIHWPGDPGVVVPEGYVLGPAGVYRVVPPTRFKDQWLKQVTIMPLWIGRKYEDGSGSDAAVQIVAEVNGRRVARVVAMSDISTASRIPQLADFGFIGFTSEHAGEIVTYLRACLAANLATLPRVQTTRTVGTERRSHSLEACAFVHGGARYLKGGALEPVELSPTAGVLARRWDMYRSEGSPEQWAEVLRVYRENRFDVASAVLFMSGASLLNRPLRLMPTTVQLAGEAAGGKTTVLRHAASMMADPAAMISMRATDNALEKSLAFSNDLPLMLDEVQSYASGPRQSQALESLLYLISEGEGKDRLRRDLSQRDTATWSCNVIVTGELDLGSLSGTGNTGSRRRVVSLFGTPFGERSPRIAALLRDLKDLTSRNFGHAIPAMGRHLLELDREQWHALRDRHRAIARRYVEEQTPAKIDAGLAETAADAFAAAEIAGELLFQLFPSAGGVGGGLPSTGEILAGPWTQTVKRLGGALRADRALDALRSFLALRRADFEDDPTPPVGVERSGKMVGRFGCTHQGGGSAIQYIAFLPEALAEYLRQQGFDYETDRKHWAERGWVVCDSQGKTTLPLRLNGTKVRMLAIRRDVIENLEGESLAPPVEDDALLL